MFRVHDVVSSVTMVFDQCRQPVWPFAQILEVGRLCRDANQYQKFNAIRESQA